MLRSAKGRSSDARTTTKDYKSPPPRKKIFNQPDRPDRVARPEKTQLATRRPARARPWKPPQARNAARMPCLSRSQPWPFVTAWPAARVPCGGSGEGFSRYGRADPAGVVARISAGTKKPPHTRFARRLVVLVRNPGSQSLQCSRWNRRHVTMSNRWQGSRRSGDLRSFTPARHPCLIPSGVQFQQSRHRAAPFTPVSTQGDGSGSVRVVAWVSGGAIVGALGAVSFDNHKRACRVPLSGRTAPGRRGSRSGFLQARSD